MLKYLNIFILLVMIPKCALSSSDDYMSERPAWVNAVEWNEKPDSTVSGTQYIMVDKQIRYFDDKPTQRFYRYVEKPLTIDALNDSGKISIYFDPIYESVKVNSLVSYRNGIKTDHSHSATFRMLDVEPEENENLYNGEKQLLILLKDLKVGDIVETSYTVSGQNPVFPNKVSRRYRLGWGVEIDNYSFELSYPAARKVKHKVFGLEDQAVIKESLGYSYLTLSLADLPSFRKEEKMHGSESVYPFIQFSEYTSWDEVSEWANGLFKEGRFSFKNNKDWSDWLERINAKNSEEEKVLEALFLVQENIRYVGIEMGENSHKPHSPDETLTNRYGDCKDKTTLLVSLLTEAGIDAEPVLVNTYKKDGVKKYIPTPSAFNHVITMVTLQGKHYFIDPTLDYQAGNTIEKLGYYYYGVALPVFTKGGLIDMPLMQGKRSKREFKEEYSTYSFDLPVILTRRSFYTGQEADYMRSRYLNNSLESIAKDHVEYYSDFYDSVDLIGEIKYIDNRQENSFTTTEQYKISGFWEYNEDKDRYKYHIDADEISYFISKKGPNDRRFAYRLPADLEIHQEIQVIYPRAYNSVSVPEEEYLFEDKYISFEVTNQDFGDRANYQFSYVSFSDKVLTEDFKEHALLLDEAIKYSGYSASLRADSSVESATDANVFMCEFLELGDKECR